MELFFSFLIVRTRSYPYQHAQTSRSGSSGENFPVDILCFWHNIDFRGKAAGGLLVTFHITLEREMLNCLHAQTVGEKDRVDGQI